MNFLFDKVEDCFYSIQDEKHVYHNGLDDNRLLGFLYDFIFSL